MATLGAGCYPELQTDAPEMCTGFWTAAVTGRACEALPHTDMDTPAPGQEQAGHSQM